MSELGDPWCIPVSAPADSSFLTRLDWTSLNILFPVSKHRKKLDYFFTQIVLSHCCYTPPPFSVFIDKAIRVSIKYTVPDYSFKLLSCSSQ